MISPTTIQNVLKPKNAAEPVRPKRSQADSPVARDENATEMKLSFLPAAKYSRTSRILLAAIAPMTQRMRTYPAKTASLIA